jgi:hypothetical protein
MTDENTTLDFDALVASANPLDATHAAALPVSDAQDELCRALLAEDPAANVGEARAPRPRWRFVLPRLALAVAVVFAGSMAVLSLGKSGDEGGGTVWAAELVRLAEASPLVLLDAPGWQVIYADEESADVGELHFSLGPPPPTPASIDGMKHVDVSTKQAALNWRPDPLSEWTRDRAASAKVRTTAPVLGATARVYQYDGGKPGHQDITALWRYDDRVLEFRAGAADIASFKVLLAALKKVDVDMWLMAMPASVVKTTDRSTVIAQMLRGVTVPPGFDPATIKGEKLTKDRYQLGASVSGTVACTWFQRWSDGRKSGDEAKVREAIAAMKTARDWPILKEMAGPGDYPEVMWQLVDAMPSGDWYGRPLAGDVDPALGCTRLGIPLVEGAEGASG